ncbi:MAG: hypothetical protein RL226_149 [Bacteroidota bacterium]
MSQFASNIKHLRAERGLTQQQLAEALGLNRPVIGAYEEGRSEPKISTLVHMASFFQVSLDRLLGEDIQAGSVRTGSGLQVLPLPVDRATGEELITVVPVRASAGYHSNFGDLEYIESLPRFDLPVKELARDRTYRLFQIEGDSMLPLESGSYVLGSYESDHRRIGGGQRYVVVTGEDVVFKRVETDYERSCYRLISENPAYETYEVPMEEVKEFWQIRAYLSFGFPGGVGYGQLEEILRILRSMEQAK